MADKKEPKSQIADEQIWRETILKELKHLIFFTQYGYNPYNKYESLADKPNSRSTTFGTPDPDFFVCMDRKYNTPKLKYPFPQTEAQEYGWHSTVLCPETARDPRFYHGSKQSEITRFMNEYFKLIDAMKMAAKS